MCGERCLDPLLGQPRPGHPSVLHHLVYECGEKALRLLFIVASHMAAERGGDPEEESSCLSLLIRLLMEEAALPNNRLAFANLTGLLTRVCLSERHGGTMRAQVLDSLWLSLARTTSEATVVHFLSWVCDLVRLSGLEEVRLHVFASAETWLERCLLLNESPAVRRAAYALSEAAVLASAPAVAPVWLCPAHQLARLSPPTACEEIECPFVSHLLAQLMEMVARAVQIKKR